MCFCWTSPPLSLGIETLGGVMTKLIEKNTTIPAKKSELFSTAEDNQPAVTVHVLQGEREMAADNKTLGRFELSGIAPAPRGMPQIEVTFDIDANGIVHVSARDKATGKEQSIQITSSSGLSKEEIDGLVREAQTHASSDRQRRELVEARNAADHMIYTTEKSLADLGAKIDANSRSMVQTAIRQLKEAAAGDDIARIRQLTEELNRNSQAMARSVYSQTNAAGRQAGGGSGHDSGPAGGHPNSGRKDDDVVDAEYEEVA